MSHKVILLGPSGVGKWDIILRILNKFPNTSTTISVDIINYQVKVNNNIIQIQFWDTCGNEEFTKNTPNLFKNASLGILVYAINDRASFNDIENWYNILRTCQLNYPIFLIGNKCDLENERKISKEEGEKKKNDYGDNIKFFLETSAKTGLNIKDLINQIALTLYKKLEYNEKMKEGRITLGKEDFGKNKNKKQKQKRGCCE